jgi:two-component system chemotaxis response regulator CheY
VLAPDTTSTSSPDAAVSRPGREVRARLKVLVAEDDDAGRHALVAAVRLLGHECRSARDGLEAWEMHQQEPADVILSDWQMPRMDGLELCRRTRVDELGARLVSAARVLGVYRRLAEKNASLRRDSQASFLAARVDELTGVGNRLSMNEDLSALRSRAKRYGHRYSIAIGDVDRFKSYNDHFGHLAGDEVLRRIARQIRETLRAGDGLYRYGGEEFVVVLPEQGLAEAERALDRVRKAVENLAIPSHREHGVVTISFGVAQVDPTIDRAPEDWLRRADAALYRAKSAGRNRVEVDRRVAKG